MVDSWLIATARPWLLRSLFGDSDSIRRPLPSGRDWLATGADWRGVGQGVINSLPDWKLCLSKNRGNSMSTEEMATDERASPMPISVGEDEFAGRWGL